MMANKFVGGLQMMFKFLIVNICLITYLVKSNQAISLLNALENDDSIQQLYLKSVLESAHISPACLNDSMDYIAALQSMLPKSTSANERNQNDTQWATQLLDATGKIPTGILEGNLNWMGSFSECLKVRAYKGPNSSSEERFRGQYCSMSLATTNGTTPSLLMNPVVSPSAVQQIPMMAKGPQLGLCWTSSCNAQEIETLVTQLLELLRLKFKTLPDFNVKIAPNLCHVKAEASTLDAVSIVIIVVYSLFGVLILSATIFELICKYKDRWSGSIQSIDPCQHGCTGTTGVLARVLLSFSAYKNGKKILNTATSDNTLTCIHGIRFLSMSWVILGHTYMFAMTLPFKNMVAIYDVIESYPMQLIFTGTFSVDSFYTLSGLLLTYVFLNELNKSGGRFGLKETLLFYFHRYWRLTPAYAMGIAFVAGIWYHLGDGPLWTNPLIEQTNCRDNWWRNLLYIQNLYDVDTKCYTVAWYLGTDMQFYVISLPLLLLLYRMPNAGLTLMGIYFAITTIASGLIIYIRDLPSNMGEDLLHTNAQRSLEYVKYVYFTPWCRMGPYLIGMLTGYILFLNKSQNRLRPIIVFVGWLAAAILGLTLIFGYHDIVKGDVIMARWVRALNGAGSRSAWGAVVCWVIYACVTGHGGYVNTILSWKALVPLSRLTYSAYLVHAYLLEGLYATQETNYYFNQYLIIILFLGFLTITMGVAFLFSLAFESPMMELEKIFLPRRKASLKEADRESVPYLGVDHQIPNANDQHA